DTPVGQTTLPQDMATKPAGGAVDTARSGSLDDGIKKPTSSNDALLFPPSSQGASSSTSASTSPTRRRSASIDLTGREPSSAMTHGGKHHHHHSSSSKGSPSPSLSSPRSLRFEPKRQDVGALFC